MRKSVAIGAGVGVAALLVLWAGISAVTAGPGKPETPGGSAVRIALVAPPPAPAPEPGGKMDVGQLVDGYEHREPEQTRDDIYAEAWLVEAYDDAYGWPSIPTRSEPPRRPQTPLPAPEPVAEPAPARAPYDPADRSFGFDQPRPDYAEQRRQRREALEAAAAERERAKVEGDLNVDEAFY